MLGAMFNWFLIWCSSLWEQLLDNDGFKVMWIPFGSGEPLPLKKSYKMTSPIIYSNYMIFLNFHIQNYTQYNLRITF